MASGPYEKPTEGKVTRADKWALGRADNKDFAVTRTCRHLGAKLDEGKVEDGCLVCPWHQAKYDVATGRMVRGPQGIFAKIPGLGALFIGLTKVLPLGVGRVTRKDDGAYIE